MLPQELPKHQTVVTHVRTERADFSGEGYTRLGPLWLTKSNPASRLAGLGFTGKGCESP